MKTCLPATLAVSRRPSRSRPRNPKPEAHPTPATARGKRLHSNLSRNRPQGRRAVPTQLGPRPKRAIQRPSTRGGCGSCRKVTGQRQPLQAIAVCTRSGTRTHTPMELEFESSASTNSAIRARRTANLDITSRIPRAETNGTWSLLLLRSARPQSGRRDTPGRYGEPSSIRGPNPALWC